MTITLGNLEKRRYDHISLKPLSCKALNPLKIQLLALFDLFSPYFRSFSNISYNKKTQKTLYLLRFRALLFLPIKTDNPLILYIHLSALLS